MNDNKSTDKSSSETSGCQPATPAAMAATIMARQRMVSHRPQAWAKAAPKYGPAGQSSGGSDSGKSDKAGKSEKKGSDE